MATRTATTPPGPGAQDLSLDPDDYLFYLLTQVAQRREAAMAEALKSHDVTVTKWRTLHLIFRLGGCTMGELARFSAADRTTLTRTVDQLCSEGHVRRSDDPNDRRRVLLSLNPSGLALRSAAAMVSHQVARDYLKDIPEPDRDQVMEVLKRLLTVMTPDARAAREVIDFRRLDAEGLAD